MIRHEDGSRELLHRYIYRVTYDDVIFSDEIVHHINEDKRDNSPKNLGKVLKEAHLPGYHKNWKKKKEEASDYDFSEFGF